MFRIILPVLALSMFLPASSLFAIDSGRTGGMGLTAHVSQGLNPRSDTRGSSVGFTRLQPGGHGLLPPAHGAPNRTLGGAYSASASVVLLSGGKGASTENTVPGRNDPPPCLAAAALGKPLAVSGSDLSNFAPYPHNATIVV